MRVILPFFTLLFLVAGTLSAQLINEFDPNPPGSDPTNSTFELSGPPSTSFSGFIVSLECDGTSLGVIDRTTAVSGTFDADGFLVVTVPDLENPSFTVILCSASPVVGTDLDTDDDALIDDVSVLGTVYDAIGVPDVTADEANLYGTQLGGADFPAEGTSSEEPSIIFRDPVSGDLYANYDRLFTVSDPMVFDLSGNAYPPADFDIDPTSTTFGSINPSNVVLPVSLTSLTAQSMPKTNMVKWATAQEYGNDYFVVERSLDGRGFREIGRVSGAGDAAVATGYTFEDETPVPGTSYYRLRQVDHAGTQAIFGPVAVVRSAEEVTAFPNPASDRLFVRGAAAGTQLTILDLNGRVINRSQASNASLDVSTLSPGTYLVRVAGPTGVETLRFVRR
ncbi:MAG: T9SS type A sorting domain-containing protein [Lewinella sp.]